MSFDDNLRTSSRRSVHERLLTFGASSPTTRDFAEGLAEYIFSSVRRACKRMLLLLPGAYRIDVAASLSDI